MHDLEHLRLHAAEQLCQLLNPELWPTEHTLSPREALLAADAIAEYAIALAQERIKKAGSFTSETLVAAAILAQKAENRQPQN